MEAPPQSSEPAHKRPLPQPGLVCWREAPVTDRARDFNSGRLAGETTFMEISIDWGRADNGFCSPPAFSSPLDSTSYASRVLWPWFSRERFLHHRRKGTGGGIQRRDPVVEDRRRHQKITDCRPNSNSFEKEQNLELYVGIFNNSCRIHCNIDRIHSNTNTNIKQFSFFLFQVYMNVRNSKSS